MDSNNQIWMEYEGLGCPEIKYLEKPFKQSRIWIMAKENKLIETTYSQIGKTRLKIKDLSSQDNVAIFHILSNNICEMCRNCIKRIELNAFPKNEKYEPSSIDLYDIKKAAEQDCLDGFLSIVIETLIEITFNFKIYKKEEDCTEYCKLLMDVLVSAQEYELEKICYEEYINQIGPSSYVKNLHLYIKTITSKSELYAFGQLINLKRLEEYEKSNKDNELYFLIANQKAFCYSILGDWEKALQEEMNALSHVKNTFSKYICHLNISRILLVLQRPSTAIATLVSAFITLNHLNNKENYETLIMLYLSKAGNRLGITERFLYKKYLGDSTSNWRIAQALNQFQIHSNYCKLECIENNYLPIELTSFQNTILEVNMGQRIEDQLIKLYEVLNHEQSVRIGSYSITVNKTNEKIQIHIKSKF